MKRKLFWIAPAIAMIALISCAHGPSTPPAKLRANPSSNYLFSVARALCEGKISPEGEAIIDDWLAQNMPEGAKK